MSNGRRAAQHASESPLPAPPRPVAAIVVLVTRRANASRGDLVVVIVGTREREPPGRRPRPAATSGIGVASESPNQPRDRGSAIVVVITTKRTPSSGSLIIVERAGGRPRMAPKFAVPTAPPVHRVRSSFIAAREREPRGKTDVSSRVVVVTDEATAAHASRSLLPFLA